MLHGLPASSVAFRGARDTSPVLPGDPTPLVETLRALHALMLDYAAQRRRAAADPEVADYWKAAENQALDRARELRRRAGFTVIP